MLPIVGEDYVEPLMEDTNVLRVENTDSISLSEVGGL